jgi:Single-strand binding protein family
LRPPGAGIESSGFVQECGDNVRARDRRFVQGAEQRTSKSGKPFTTATLRTQDGEGARWLKLVAFAEPVQSELMRLMEGGAVAVKGVLKVGAYLDKAGEPKPSIDVVVDGLLALEGHPRDGRSSDGSALGGC